VVVPLLVFIWAVHNKSKKTTDTLVYDSYYSPNKIVTIKAIKNDSLVIDETALSNENKIVETEINNDTLANQDLLLEAKQPKNQQSNIILYSMIGLVALIGMALLYRGMKNKTNLNGLGNRIMTMIAPWMATQYSFKANQLPLMGPYFPITSIAY
jgi:hypothetical protein